MSTALVLALLCAVAAIAYGIWSISWILAKTAGNAHLNVCGCKLCHNQIPSSRAGNTIIVLRDMSAAMSNDPTADTPTTNSSDKPQTQPASLQQK